MATVSLDVEGTLADAHGRLLAVYNDRHGTDHELADMNDWHWVREELDYDEFMSITQREWAENHGAIEPLEDGLAKAVDRLCERHTVDVVTARRGVEDEMQEWLDDRGMDSYRDFHSIDPSSTKATMGYDIYIDDKPGLADMLGDGQIQYVIRQPYNRDSRMPLDKTIPVMTVAEAAESICAYKP